MSGLSNVERSKLVGPAMLFDSGTGPREMAHASRVLLAMTMVVIVAGCEVVDSDDVAKDSSK